MNPPLYGNEIFWVMAGIIGFLLIAVMELAGAVSRSRQAIGAVPAGVSADGLAPRPAGRPFRGDSPQPPGRRARSSGRLLAVAVLIAGIGLLIADKAHLKPSGTSPGTASPKPAVTITAHAPAPVTHPKPTIPPAVVHAAGHSLLTSGDITAIAIIAILALAAVGINRVIARNR